MAWSMALKDCQAGFGSAGKIAVIDSSCLPWLGVVADSRITNSNLRPGHCLFQCSNLFYVIFDSWPLLAAGIFSVFVSLLFFQECSLHC